MRNGFARLKAVILVTIILFGILTLWLALSNASTASSNQKRVGDIQQISQAFSIFFKENGFYPPGRGTPTGFDLYLNPWPAPPAGGGCSNNSNIYYYSPQNSGDDYSVTFCLGAKTSGLTAGVHQLTSKGIQ